MSTLAITNAASMYSYDVIASLVEGFRDVALSTVYRSSRAISHTIKVITAKVREMEAVGADSQSEKLH
jgi:hypothetical protein